MDSNYSLERVDNPEGHQVCQVDCTARKVRIQKKGYVTEISFGKNGGYDVKHQKIPDLKKQATPN